MVYEKEEAKDFDSVADQFLNEEEKETPADSSAEKNQEDDVKADETTTAEVDKTEKVKEVESDTSLSVEEKIAKIKEILGEDEKAIDAYIKQKGYHNDPAWQKQRELIEKLKKEGTAKSQIDEEDKKALEEFKKFRTSPDYIQTSMKAQGFTQEAIDKKLVESGFEPSSKPQDDVKLVVDKLGLKLDEMSSDEKVNVLANISDVAKIADIIINDRLGKVLPKELAPFKDNIETIQKTENSSKLISTMKEMTKAEGVLDFEKDIEPALHKFMDENPDIIQQDVFDHFKEISRKMTVERLKTGKKKEERDNLKQNLRQNIPLSTSNPNIKKTGDFEKDADAFLDSLNVG